MTLDSDCKQSESTQYELLKGAHLQRYSKRVYPKQGQREWVNTAMLTRKYGNSSKLRRHELERIAFQGVTGMDDTRRLKGSRIPSGYYLANSVNYMSLLSGTIHNEYLLALFNSRLLEWRFKLTSTNNNVNNYEVHSLPFKRVELTTPESERRDVVKDATDLYEADTYAEVVGWSERELAWTPKVGLSGEGRNDTVHDLLAYLAGKMISMHEERVDIQRVWKEWIEAAVPKAHKLTKTFREAEWAEVGCEQGWPGVLAEFQKRKAVPDARTLQELKRETEKALAELCPLRERIRNTDDLIDQIVYRLYGLTEDEIATVEAATQR